MSVSNFWTKIREKRFGHVLKIISNSAAFALLLSLILFGIEMFSGIQESKEVTENLLKIQNSLSTRYLGQFPEFLTDINQLYLSASHGDSIVILEDVLYYGLVSNPHKFYVSCLNLLDLAEHGCPIMISYYRPNTLAYNMTVQEWLLSAECYKNYRDTLMLFNRKNFEYRQSRKKILSESLDNNVPREEVEQRLFSLMNELFGDIVEPRLLQLQQKYMEDKAEEWGTEKEQSVWATKDDREIINTILLERYFSKTRSQDPKKFKAMVAKYRNSSLKNDDFSQNDVRPTVSYRVRKDVEKLSFQLDSVRNKYIGDNNKSVNDIKYDDFRNMFLEMSQIIEKAYRQYPSINLLPVGEFLSVRSWLICSPDDGDKAIMAFPSRYSSSEIGFFTIDGSTSDYVKTMQKGILINYSEHLIGE
ncbi:MAG: hypothetical protein IKN91_08735 [Paludibacteraceae bacterium]|nr:hypothetical protein [Paludibacteraceae bacterium]